MKHEKSQLDTMISQLPEEMSPNRDLWQGIEQAVAKTPQDLPQDASNVRWGVIAAAIAPIALVSGIYLNAPQPLDQSPPWLEPISASFELQKRTMLKQVSNQQEINENWQQTLAELEEAERALKEALVHQPEDPALMKMLNQVYQQQLEVITKSHQSKFMHI